MKKALGLIETVGKAAAIEAMDTAVKAAEVELSGLENSRGNGRMTVTLAGEVSAVKAAVEAAIRSVTNMGGTVFASSVIARPSDELEHMLTEGLHEKERETEETAVKESEERMVSCNLCQDPNCPRVRGEPKVKCIHYVELMKK